jgi:predicted translin family RNA/ssDNA-binding protein|tara:strand:+ start:22097 stop:22666 length:570 start_codon:yes stop_codon:yes gene_type:complete
MISKSFIKKLKSQIEKSDSGRAKIIRETHPMVREAKHAIFKIHRGEIKEAEKSLEALGQKLKTIIKEAEKANSRGEGTLHAAVEEYLEALYLLKVIQNKSIPQKLSFVITADEQLAALSDLTGELVRAATLEVTRGNLKSIKQYRDATEELFGVLLQMNLRGQLRQKRDDARRNLKRLEEILYDVSLKN